MNEISFYTPAPRTLLGVVLLLCVLGLVMEIHSYLEDGSLYSPLTSAFYAAGAVLMVQALWNHRRPVLEISDDAIEHGAINSLSRKRIPRSRVEGIAESQPRRVILQTRSGRRVTIRLRYVRKREREAARQAIERWVEEHAGREA